MTHPKRAKVGPKRDSHPFRLPRRLNPPRQIADAICIMTLIPTRRGGRSRGMLPEVARRTSVEDLFDGEASARAGGGGGAGAAGGRLAQRPRASARREVRRHPLWPENSTAYGST